MFKDILLPAMAGDLSDAAVDSARALAQMTDGRIIALAAVSVFVPQSAEWIRSPLATYANLHEAATAALAEQVRHVEDRLAKEPVPYEVLGSNGFWLTPEEVLAAYAHAVDVIVLDSRHTQDDRGRRLFAGALIGSGRPVLLVPAGQPVRTPPARVLVAWKDSAEAAHALHDALPLLQRANRVDVVVVGHPEEAVPMQDDTSTRLLAHLKRHDIEATFSQVPHTGSTGATIARHALDSQADMIVAGGYSRPRALQLVLGGVTRYLMEHSSVPVLFSH